MALSEEITLTRTIETSWRTPRLWRFAGYLAMLATVIVIGLPVYWTVSAAFKTTGEIYRIPVTWLPTEPTLANFPQAWNAAPFERYYLNSFITTLGGMTAEVILAIMSAYALAFLRFPRKQLVFLLLLAALMIPVEITIVPNYLTVARLGWINTYAGIIIPGAAIAYGTFLLRQAFLSLPYEVIEAARVDGAGHLRIMFNVVMPMAQPAIVTMALLSMVAKWNDFLWPLLVTNTTNMRTLPIGIFWLRNSEGLINWGVIETAQKYTAGLQANTIPDLILLSDVWWFGFYVAGAISELDGLAQQAGLEFSDYEPVLLNEGNRQGKQFWIPFARSTPLFYYNKDLWAEAGLPDRAPETWAEFGEWAPQLLQRDGSTLTRSAFVHPDGASYIAWLFQGVTWQHGGKYSNDDFTMTMTDPNTIRAAQFYQDTVRDLGWATLGQDINRDFLGGAAAAMMASTGGLAGITANATFPVGVGFLPKEANFGCCTGGAGLAIPSGIPDEKKLAAMTYIAFATNTEQAGAWARDTGYMPVRISTKQTPDMVAFFEENPNFKTAVDQLPLTRAQDAARVFVRNGDQIIGKGLERIIVNGEGPATVFADIDAELTRAAQPILEDLREVEG